MRLPKLPYTVKNYQKEAVVMRGINYSDQIQDGDLSESVNLSARRYPYITTRNHRTVQMKNDTEEYANATALTAWGKLAVVEGANLLYDGKVVGNVMPGEKQFAVVNTKLCVFPDKKYIDLTEGVCKNLEAVANLSGAVIAESGISGTVTGLEEITHDGTAWRTITSGQIVRQFKIYSSYTEDEEGNKTFDESTAEWAELWDFAYKPGDYIGKYIIPVGDAELGFTFYMRDHVYANNGGSDRYDYGEPNNDYYGVISQVTYDQKGYDNKDSGFDCTIRAQIYQSDNMTLMDLFRTGDVVEIENSVIPANNKTVKLEEVKEQSITVTGGAFIQSEYYCNITTDLPAGSNGFTLSGITTGYTALMFETSTPIRAGTTLLLKTTNGELPVYITMINSQGVVLNTFTISATTSSSAAGFWEGKNYLTFTKYISETITIRRKIPEMDYICSSDNRLWGVNSEEQTIYASALGDPTNFYIYDGLSTDSYAVAVSTDGKFTGCCYYSGCMLFWKENALHKILGSYPAEYSLYTYNVEGLQDGSYKSLQTINETLYYMGVHGVYAYSGGTPYLISPSFGNRVFTDAVSGTDGENYYLSVQEGENTHLFVYETRQCIWMREDESYARDFARLGEALYFLSGDGKIYRTDSGETDANIEWMAQFAPFYETIQGRKRYSKLLLRMELPKGSYLITEIRVNGGKWRETGKIIGRNYDTIPLRIVPTRCDRFEVRLRGKGPCTILSMMREFSVGSDV